MPEQTCPGFDLARTTARINRSSLLCPYHVKVTGICWLRLPDKDYLQIQGKGHFKKKLNQITMSSRHDSWILPNLHHLEKNLFEKAVCFSLILRVNSWDCINPFNSITLLDDTESTRSPCDVYMNRAFCRGMCFYAPTNLNKPVSTNRYIITPKSPFN